MTRNDVVTHIADLIELHDPPHWELDWPDIERKLGHALPSDYKELCARIPPGRYHDHFWILHPIGSKGASLVARNDELIAIAEEFMLDEDDECPTESGRVFPCLVTDNGDVGYWIADSDEPEEWKVAVNVARGPEWESTGLSLTGFIFELLSGEYESGIFPPSLRERQPIFRSSI
ncbi:hypothetical protein ACWGRF_31580 [Streptomyces zhihengii]